VGFVHKSLELASLPRTIRGVLAGEAAVSRRLALRLVERMHSVPGDGAGMRPVHSVLSSREWEVLDKLVDGATTEQIADDFVLSPETVRSHVKNILRKLHVSSRAEAIATAQRYRATGVESF
jgi:two-component system nitrate/nitrite response regulator NarL